MSNNDFKSLGKSLALTEMGVPMQDQGYFISPEEDNLERSRIAINFCKEASSVLPYLGEGGDFAGILFSKIANTSPEELDPTIVDFVLDSALELRGLTKQAVSVGGVAAGATNYVPSIIKGFIALAALSGATGGATLWAGRKALQGPDEDEIAKLEAGVKEYHKLRGRVLREQKNKKIEDKYL